MIFNSEEVKKINKDKSLVFKRIFIPKDKINIVEETCSGAAKINGKFVNHSFDKVIEMIEIYQ